MLKRTLRGRAVYYGTVVFFKLLVLAWPSHAKVVGLFDFDGTLVEDRGSTSAWITPWILKRIEQLHSGFQQLPHSPIEVTLETPEQISYYNQLHGTSLPTDQPARVTLSLPDQIQVSYDEFYQIESDLAKGESVIGGLRPILLREDPLRPERPRLIVPGYYRSFDLTFKYYRESVGARPKNYIRADFLTARERASLLGPDFRWQGHAFPLFRAFMSHENTVSNVQLFTSRGHKQSDYAALWDEMVRQGDLPRAKGRAGFRPVVHSLSRPEARVFGRTLGEKKVQVVRNVVESLYHSASPRHWVNGRNGPVLQHTLIIAEDEPSYVDGIAQYLLNMSGSLYADRVELVLLNTGSDQEVANARFPYRWTRFEAGRRARSATPEEIENWLDPEFHRLSSSPQESVDCEQLLNRRPK